MVSTKNNSLFQQKTTLCILEMRERLLEEAIWFLANLQNIVQGSHEHPEFSLRGVSDRKRPCMYLERHDQNQIQSVVVFQGMVWMTCTHMILLVTNNRSTSGASDCARPWPRSRVRGVCQSPLLKSKTFGIELVLL